MPYINDRDFELYRAQTELISLLQSQIRNLELRLKDASLFIMAAIRLGTNSRDQEEALYLAFMRTINEDHIGFAKILQSIPPKGFKGKPYVSPSQ